MLMAASLEYLRTILSTAMSVLSKPLRKLIKEAG
jgi:hypothetical protein